MTKKLSLLILTSIIVSSCSVTKNWKSDHPSDNFLKASFDEFTGTEKLKFPKQANALVYLSSTVSTSQGKVLLSLKNTTLSTTNKVNHQKISLSQSQVLKISGEKAHGSFALSYPTLTEKKIQVNYHQNIELLGLCYTLLNLSDFNDIPDDQTFEMNGEKVKIKDLYAITTKIGNEFKPFLTSKNLAIIKTFFDKDFYLHNSNFLLQLDNFPNASVSEDNPFLSHYASKAEAEKLVNAFNAFALEINFQDFLKRYSPYYQKMIQEVEQNIPQESFIVEMEHLYRKNVQNYRLYPSLTIPFGQGFAAGNTNTIGNIFASFNKPKEVNQVSNLQLGYDNSTSLRDICVHEFGHSFVNPAIDKVDESLLKDKEALFEPIKDNMSQQGYSQWKICLYEHFNRANEVIIARLIGDNKKAEKILQENVKNKSFIYLPQIVEKLEYWYNNEFLDKTYDQKVSDIIAELK
ncbi:DUF4932 domain-containing protein [Flectobacillus sp. BAB-3569]|uniref:DUF4932 domain-containing protein n=1 Tax=Flectobacillus sp. BAB-3569 TaxID=1509483 RepID=UPI000BA34F2B|nr:DUF4932 domain-containing protein [Flectobacillus sp. BAB-3569]PAC31974.1 hypothetical protein BWI92_06335 [Flectobacillus sp. BAB-3569]